MPTHTIAPDTLNAAQAADMLFADIETILILARSGELPGAKVGKSWVFLREDVIEFLRGRVRAETGQRKQPVLPNAVLLPRPSRQRRQPPVLPALPMPQGESAQHTQGRSTTKRQRLLTDDCTE